MSDVTQNTLEIRVSIDSDKQLGAEEFNNKILPCCDTRLEIRVFWSNRGNGYDNSRTVTLLLLPIGCYRDMSHTTGPISLISITGFPGTLAHPSTPPREWYCLNLLSPVPSYIWREQKSRNTLIVYFYGICVRSVVPYFTVSNFSSGKMQFCVSVFT